jgi:hypothetical protein
MVDYEKPLCRRCGKSSRAILADIFNTLSSTNDSSLESSKENQIEGLSKKINKYFSSGTTFQANLLRSNFLSHEMKFQIYKL